MGRTRGRPRGGWVSPEERKPALILIRERHRLLAKYAAMGMTRNEIATIMDYSPERVGQLLNDPAMQELVVQFRDHPDVVQATAVDTIAATKSSIAKSMLRAALSIEDTLNYYEDSGERMPIRDAAKIFELFADRSGVPKHSTQTVKHDFASALEEAVARSNKAKLIDAKVSPQVDSRQRGGAIPTPPLAPPRPTLTVLSSGPTLEDGGEREPEFSTPLVPAPKFDRRF